MRKYYFMKDNFYIVIIIFTCNAVVTEGSLFGPCKDKFGSRKGPNCKVLLIYIYISTPLRVIISVSTGFLGRL